MTLPCDVAPVHIRSLAPYIPGKPLAELEREYGIQDSIKLASNENPLGPGPRARRAMAAAIEYVGLYPDGNGFELKQALCRKHNCAMENITLGNGSNDVLVMVAQAFLQSGSEAVFSEYAFAVYQIAVHAAGATARVAPAHPREHPQALGHDLQAIARLVNERTRVVFIANPNNPTGTWINAQQLESFIGTLPQSTIVVVDEAYIEYVSEPNFPDSSGWLSRYPNLVVTRTFSKAYGLAGLRVGYALSERRVADLLNRVRQPFNVNSLALAAATAALEDDAHLKESIRVNQAGLEQLAAGLSKLEVKFHPSVGNFVLIDCGRAAAPIYEQLLRGGVIVRPLANYGLPQHLRVTVGTAVQNARFLQALASALS